MNKFCILLFILPFYVHAVLLQEKVSHDLELIGLPPPHLRPQPGNDLLDVAIIGGGQSGLSLCFALYKQGIYNIQIFDDSCKNCEGPWLTTARMLTLRSSKEAQGPALDIPSLTFHSWYEAQGYDWKTLGKIATPLWGEYLHWYRDVLSLPVKNGWRLVSIVPQGDLMKLVFNDDREVYARKVVLATGLDGCGGFEIPTCVEQDIPDSIWFHTGQVIDPALFFQKRLCVIGSSASAFDIAATALSAGAEHVAMIMRRAEMPMSTPFALFSYWPAFFSMGDYERAQFFQKAWSAGLPVPEESIARLQKWGNFQLHAQTCVECISLDEEVIVKTDKGPLQTDLIVLATGYAVDLTCVPEISHFAKHILTWGDRLEGLSPKLAQFPYLGPSFQFLEKQPGLAPYLKNIYCFNYGASLSHGHVVVDIDSIPIGTGRLAEGIATDLFLSKFLGEVGDDEISSSSSDAG